MLDWWIWVVIGYIFGFISPVIILVVYGRKQIREALKQFKTGEK